MTARKLTSCVLRDLPTCVTLWMLGATLEVWVAWIIFSALFSVIADEVKGSTPC